jgi:Family of unknown function (DUF6526)
MQAQNYENHKKFTPLHHFVQLPLTLLLTIWFAFEAVSNKEVAIQKIWFALTLIGFSVILLSILTRMHYGFMMQNRIIRLEMRYRYYRLTQQPFEELEKKLTNGQIMALRFAPDEELIALIEKAIAEKLTPDSIKRQVQQWQGDYMRV